MAGTTTYIGFEQGSNSYKLNPVIGFKYDIIADAVDQSIPSIGTRNIAGFIVAIDVKFGSTPPDSLNIILTNSMGIQILSKSAVATSRITLDDSVPFVGPLTLSFSGNNVNSAEAEIMLLVI